MKKKNVKLVLKIVVIVVLLTELIVGYFHLDLIGNLNNLFNESYSLEEVPNYTGKPYVLINDNEPNFTEEDYQRPTFENYSNQDFLGRSRVAFANISKELMSTDKRGSIGMIKPSGWHTVKYDNIDGKYLYNRCHLIGFQLTGENANAQNLITCTRQMNTGAMLDYENKVAEYIKKTNNHVLYRVTPIYEGNNLLASGVQMEGLSLEDGGRGIKFNIYVYNVQDGIAIDYTNGASKLKE